MIIFYLQDDLKINRKKDQAVQMKIDYECFIIGTKFVHYFMLQWANEMEKSCFKRMMELFESFPFVGSGHSQGNGEVMLGYTESVDDLSSEPYLNFLNQNKQEIKDTIEYLSDQFEGSK